MSRKKTHEEYVAELAIKNPNVEVVGEYIDSNTKITHRCKIHDYYWEAFPNNVLRGYGCKKCQIEKSHAPFTKSHEQYVLDVKNVNPDIEVLEQYINSKTPILHKCLIHGVEWKVLPSSVLNGHGCPECARIKRINSKLKTHEQYVKEVSVISPHIEVIENYIDSHTHILHHCKIHDYYWKSTPNNILNGCSCPVCGGSILKTHDEYVRQVSLINPHIEVIGKYINSHTPILHKCTKDNYEWYSMPTHILNSKGCPKCAGTMKKTHEEYVIEVASINPDIEVIEKYINSKTSILHRCKIDGHQWYALPLNILKGRGCPQCVESNGERQIRHWLNLHSIQYISQMTFENCKDIKLLPFDFYLPTYNIAIEFDGRQHHEPVERFGGQKAFENTLKHDNIKNEYCKNNGISLLRIPYFKNVEEELNNFLFI